MTSNRSDETEENLRTIYDAVVDYHNNLVHMRFTVAGLYLAATGFFASTWFAGLALQKSYFAIPILGLVLTLVCWLLEIRTYQLMRNLGDRGIKIEKELKVGSTLGFFALMKKQTLQARIPFFRKDLPSWKIIRYLVSHSTGLDLLYISVLAFWIVILWLR